MRDSYINAMNIQKNVVHWMDAVSENLVNAYTPGYRENQISFKTYLDSAMIDKVEKNSQQGKSIPGKSDSNVFLLGNGYFVIRNEEGKLAYTRFGDFKFDGEGVYKAADGSKVQGYILNDNGEIMAGTKSLDSEAFKKMIEEGGASAIPTTEIKLWIDPDNGKYLGKYEEYEIKGDGVLYGKADNGKIEVPIFKLALMNFNNPDELFEFKQGQFLETAYSGTPKVATGEVRSGHLEISNVDFRANVNSWKLAQKQYDCSGKIMSTYKDLLTSIMDMIN